LILVDSYLGNRTLKNTNAEVELNLIDAHPRQPRLGLSKEFISNLAESLEDPDVGLLPPVVLRPKPNAPGRYELIAGEQQVLAARKAAWLSIPAIVLADENTSLSALNTLPTNCPPGFDRVDPRSFIVGQLFFGLLTPDQLADANS
jgi:hypothetical protein